MVEGARVLVLEPHAGGHHGPYLTWMMEALLTQAATVKIVTLPDTLEHPSLDALRRRHVVGDLELLAIRAPRGFSRGALPQANLIWRELSYWRLFRYWHRAVAPTFTPDIVFLPYLDYCLYATGLLGSPFGNSSWAGVAMRPSFHYPSMAVRAPAPGLAFAKQSLFFRLLAQSTLKALLTIDEPLISYADKIGRQSPKLRFLPEPAIFAPSVSKAEARARLKIQDGRFVLLAYGLLTTRKGVAQLLSSMSNEDFPSNVDVVLAGKADSDIKDVLRQPHARTFVRQGRLRVIDRVLTDQEEAAVFAASDAVWLGYNAHYGGSGILVQAAALGLPTIACEDGIIGWQTRRHSLGLCMDPDDTQAVVTAVQLLARNTPLCASLGANGRQAYSQHTVRHAAEVVQGALGVKRRTAHEE